MRGKWNNKNLQPSVADGHPITQTTVLEEQAYKPKLVGLHHSPSLRAIRAYNDLPVEGSFQAGTGIDTSMFVRDGRYGNHRREDETDVYSESIESDTKQTDFNLYDYASMGTLSLRTNNSGSEFNSDLNEMGSTVKLVSPKMEMSCQTCCSFVSTAACTISMAAGIGNLYRLPQTTLIRGGLPFLVAHIILTIFVGLPLLFLELGIGQLAQEGFIKTWRAVPFFRGIGYIKLIAGCLLSIYYPLYMGLALFYIIWVLKGPLPFQECSSGVKITEDGYSTYGKDGQQCLRDTFLKQPFVDPYWYGIYVGLLLIIWIIITVLSIRKTKSYIYSLIILLFPTIVCYIALIAKSALLEQEFNGLTKFFNNADWTSLTSANVWYYACIQVFFSSNVGFGSFVTNAGIIYNKVNPFWTALGYITVNIIIGVGSIIISQTITGNLNITAKNGDVAELHLVSLIYDTGYSSTNANTKCWIVLIYTLFVLAGFINMATLTYTLLKALTVEIGNKLKWWHASIILSFLAYVLGCAILLQSDFDIVHLLDHYIVGNLILITAVIEVLALIAFYSTEKIKSDFEFMLGHILSKFWLVLWWLLPLLLTIIFAWGMITLPMEGIYKDDPSWLYGIGWGVVLTATVFIFLMGFYIVTKQDGYTMKDKFKASLKPSNNWGPKDPMSRHNWVQWNSKAQNGERDFTLKRKGTKDYTRSIKKNAKKVSTELTAPVQGVYLQNGASRSTNNIYNELYDLPTESNSTLERVPEHNQKRKPLRVTSLIDSLDSSEYSYPFSGREVRKNNPLARRNLFRNFRGSSASEEYGSFRKGPFVISDDSIEHVCYRKYSESEDATVL